MKPFETLTVSGKEYNLKISMGEMVKLEEQIGTDLLTGMEKLTAATTLTKYYFAALKPWNDSISTIEDVYQLFDDYITQGGTYEELQHKMVEVLVLSGIMSQKVFEISQKALAKQKEALEKLMTDNGDADMSILS